MVLPVITRNFGIYRYCNFVSNVPGSKVIELKFQYSCIVATIVLNTFELFCLLKIDLLVSQTYQSRLILLLRVIFYWIMLYAIGERIG